MRTSLKICLFVIIIDVFIRWQGNKRKRVEAKVQRAHQLAAADKPKNEILRKVPEGSLRPAGALRTRRVPTPAKNLPHVAATLISLGV